MNVTLLTSFGLAILQRLEAQLRNRPVLALFLHGVEQILGADTGPAPVVTPPAPAPAPVDSKPAA